MNVNERLAEYVIETVVVSTLETSIIPYENWKKLICDTELLREINLTWIRELLERFFSPCEKNPNFFVGLLKVDWDYSKNKYFPEFVLCKNGKYYHVAYHSNWICKNCYHVHGAVIMPLVEAESIYYGKNRWEILNETPDIFTKRKCEKCGNVLIGHLMFVDEL